VTAWWEEMFASPAWQAVQLAWESAEDADDQVRRLELALRLEPGMRVLDVPCGTGRIAGRLAARGYDVAGVDRTQRFLEVARARGDGVRYVRADMREVVFGSVFDAAICLWGSFGYFDDAGDRAQARSAAQALEHGGRYLIDALVEEAIAPWFRERESYEVGDTRVEERRAWAPGGRIETTWTFTRAGERAVGRSSIRIYSLDELTDLLARVGFTSFEARDDHLQPFGGGSSRLWLVATR
jgi:SAM-dependent methyltransferase